jgi:hypothetical protein
VICLAAGALYLATFCMAAAVIIQLNSTLAPRHRWAFSATLILALGALALISLPLFILPALA